MLCLSFVNILGSIEELLAEDTVGEVAENPELEENTGLSFDVGLASSEVGGEEQLAGGADEVQSREDLSCVEAEMGISDITASQTPMSMPAANSTLRETGR